MHEQGLKGAEQAQAGAGMMHLASLRAVWLGKDSFVSASAGGAVPERCMSLVAAPQRGSEAGDASFQVGLVNWEAASQENLAKWLFGLNCQLLERGRALIVASCDEAGRPNKFIVGPNPNSDYTPVASHTPSPEAGRGWKPMFNLGLGLDLRLAEEEKSGNGDIYEALVSIDHERAPSDTSTVHSQEIDADVWLAHQSGKKRPPARRASGASLQPELEAMHISLGQDTNDSRGDSGSGSGSEYWGRRSDIRTPENRKDSLHSASAPPSPELDFGDSHRHNRTHSLMDILLTPSQQRIREQREQQQQEEQLEEKWVNDDYEPSESESVDYSRTQVTPVADAQNQWRGVSPLVEGDSYTRSLQGEVSGGDSRASTPFEERGDGPGSDVSDDIPETADASRDDEAGEEAGGDDEAKGDEKVDSGEQFGQSPSPRLGSTLRPKSAPTPSSPNHSDEVAPSPTFDRQRKREEVLARQAKRQQERKAQREKLRESSNGTESQFARELLQQHEFLRAREEERQRARMRMSLQEEQDRAKREQRREQQRIEREEKDREKVEQRSRAKEELHRRVMENQRERERAQREKDERERGLHEQLEREKASLEKAKAAREQSRREFAKRLQAERMEEERQEEERAREARENKERDRLEREMLEREGDRRRLERIEQDQRNREAALQRQKQLVQRLEAEAREEERRRVVQMAQEQKDREQRKQAREKELEKVRALARERERKLEQEEAELEKELQREKEKEALRAEERQRQLEQVEREREKRAQALRESRASGVEELQKAVQQLKEREAELARARLQRSGGPSPGLSGDRVLAARAMRESVVPQLSERLPSMPPPPAVVPRPPITPRAAGSQISPRTPRTRPAVFSRPPQTETRPPARLERSRAGEWNAQVNSKGAVTRAASESPVMPASPLATPKPEAAPVSRLRRAQSAFQVSAARVAAEQAATPTPIRPVRPVRASVPQLVDATPYKHEPRAAPTPQAAATPHGRKARLQPSDWQARQEGEQLRTPQQRNNKTEQQRHLATINRSERAKDKRKKTKFVDDPATIFQFVAKLGEGSYGEVYKAIDKRDRAVVAIKILDIQKADDVSDLKNEIKILRRCHSRFIVAYEGTYVRHNTIWIVMEYCSGGSLLDLLTICNRTLNEPEIAAVMYMSLAGLGYLHEQRKVHRDVKAGNILLDEHGICKMADFGVSAELTSAIPTRKTVIGSPYWMAPEVLTPDAQYNTRADIWSLGITAIELATGRPPRCDIHPMQAIFRIPTMPAPTLPPRGRYSREFKDFTRTVLRKDPEKRPSAAELLHHPFVSKAVIEGPNAPIALLAAETLRKIERYRSIKSRVKGAGPALPDLAAMPADKRHPALSVDSDFFGSPDSTMRSSRANSNADSEDISPLKQPIFSTGGSANDSVQYTPPASSQQAAGRRRGDRKSLGSEKALQPDGAAPVEDWRRVQQPSEAVTPMISDMRKKYGYTGELQPSKLAFGGKPNLAVPGTEQEVRRGSRTHSETSGGESVNVDDDDATDEEDEDELALRAQIQHLRVQYDELVNKQKEERQQQQRQFNAPSEDDWYDGEEVDLDQL